MDSDEDMFASSNSEPIQPISLSPASSHDEYVPSPASSHEVYKPSPQSSLSLGSQSQQQQARSVLLFSEIFNHDPDNSREHLLVSLLHLIHDICVVDPGCLSQKRLFSIPDPKCLSRNPDLHKKLKNVFLAL